MFGIDLPTFDDIASGVTQFISGGFLNYSGGKLNKNGYAMEAFGDVTGANAARKALMDQNQAVKDYQLQQEKLFQDEQQRKWNQELMASRAAQAAQRSSLGLGASGGREFTPSSLYLGGL